MKSLILLSILALFFTTGCMGPVIIAYDTSLSYDTGQAELGGLVIKQPKTNIIKDPKVDSVNEKPQDQDGTNPPTKGVLDVPEFMNEPNQFVTPVDMGWKKQLLQ
jgi:hypothetical protein